MPDTVALYDTHAHLISDDWDRYPTRALRADLPTPKRTDYTVTAEHLIGLMDGPPIIFAGRHPGAEQAVGFRLRHRP